MPICLGHTSDSELTCAFGCKQATNDGYPHHLMGALPGSFNYATLSDSATAHAAAGSPNFAASQVGTTFGTLL